MAVAEPIVGRGATLVVAHHRQSFWHQPLHTNPHKHKLFRRPNPMAFTIIPAHDERVTVEIHVPVKGRKTPLKFIAPRFEFIPREQTKKFDDWMTKLAADAGDEELLVTEEMMLNFWIEHLGLKDADALLDLTRGEKRQIWQHWAEVSNTTLGESEASSDS